MNCKIFVFRLNRIDQMRDRVKTGLGIERRRIGISQKKILVSIFEKFMGIYQV